MALVDFRPDFTIPDDPESPPDPDGCPFVDEPFLLPEFKRWTLDTCPQVLCGIVIRPEEHVFEGMTSGVTAGDASPATLHGARTSPDVAGNDDEPCMRHYGRTTLAPNGDARRFMCTDYRDGAGPETHELLPFVRFNLDLMGPLIERGDMAMLTTLQAPGWHEAILLSHAKLCRGAGF